MPVEDGSVRQEDAGAPLQSSEPAEPAFHELIQLERQRINRDNQRSGVMLKALEYSDAQDQRQFQYVSETRDAQIALEDKRLQFFRRLVWILLAVVVAVGLTLFGFAFFGDMAQRALVGKIVTPALIAVAGYGVIATLSKAIKALSRSNQSST